MIILNIIPLSRHYYLTIISPLNYLTSISRPGAASIHQSHRHQYYLTIISPLSRSISPFTIVCTIINYKLSHRCLASISPDISPVSRRGLAYFTIISPAFSISPPFHQYLAVVSPISPDRYIISPVSYHHLTRSVIMVNRHYPAMVSHN